MFRYLLTFCFFAFVAGKQSFPVKRITNGQVTNIVYFPYQVSISDNGDHICGGAIIKRNFIISAAHCFKHEDVERYEVRAGSSKHNTEGHIFPVKEVVKHNLYELLRNEKTLFDLAIVQVKFMYSKFSKFIQPIALPHSNFPIPYTAEGTLTGWGTMQEGSERPSDVLRYANIKIWKQSECKKVFGRRKIKDVVFCSGSNGKDACNGDSGGPLVVNKKLIGIVSWGRGCGRKGFPTVYTNVVDFLPWIEATLNYLNLQP